MDRIWEFPLSTRDKWERVLLIYQKDVELLELEGRAEQQQFAKALQDVREQLQQSEKDKQCLQANVYKLKELLAERDELISTLGMREIQQRVAAVATPCRSPKKLNAHRDDSPAHGNVRGREPTELPDDPASSAASRLRAAVTDMLRSAVPVASVVEPTKTPMVPALSLPLAPHPMLVSRRDADGDPLSAAPPSRPVSRPGTPRRVESSRPSPRLPISAPATTAPPARPVSRRAALFSPTPNSTGLAGRHGGAGVMQTQPKAALLLPERAVASLSSSASSLREVTAAASADAPANDAPNSVNSTNSAASSSVAQTHASAVASTLASSSTSQPFLRGTQTSATSTTGTATPEPAVAGSTVRASSARRGREFQPLARVLGFTHAALRALSVPCAQVG